MIRKQLAEVEQHIQAACDRSGRRREDVTLIAVSKTKPVEALQEAYDAGVRIFGENKVQELTDKYEVLPKDIQWHMIGHLQTNKVKYIVDKVACIHSVDSLKLAEVIEREAAKKDCKVNILIEVNVAQENSKFGISMKDVLPFVKKVSTFPHICIQGLMTVAPFVENAEENRTIFKNLHNLSVDIMSKNIDNVNASILSMGMTNDYEVAIEEGASMVRVGTGIFGIREYSI
ncbi:YggS family pyridoxal phosphate-dependent enzyme [Mediterraneibacter agrestimuris]|uniref:YggS family pyridoxal phosphate-dependent enzyme n=1 Tax=Mediterraneibacter agrestimuris TaxID=2941333 RepID=UPI002041A31D|nr:YggS family pyridoxal phosphate-dependent enzyme [Mediterraneibacter agrestimuris]